MTTGVACNMATVLRSLRALQIYIAYYGVEGKCATSVIDLFAAEISGI